MRELDTLNERPGVATDAMALFLAINTAGVAVLPLGVIAIRAQLGSTHAAAILLPTVLAALCSTAVAIALAKLLQRRPRYRFEAQVPGRADTSGPAAPLQATGDVETMVGPKPDRDPVRATLLWGFALALLAAAIRSVARADDPGTAARTLADTWLLPALMGWIVLFGWSRRVGVYDAVVRGGREGLEIAVAIAPFLVAILVAVGMLRASGGLEHAVRWIDPVTSWLGFPAEALPMALIRPLSGSAALGVMTDTMKAHGPDSFAGYLVSVINGSSETTFYVIALYFGSVRVRAIRHTLLACLGADLAGTAAALLWCKVFF
jgi:spore maturation protein SpmB